MFGACLIGAGRISSLHVLGYINNEDAQVMAICDKDLKRAKNLAKLLPYPVKTYKNFEDALKREDIDFVEVLTPHATHEEIVIKSAEHGKHVSCQKVPATTLSSFDKMIKATKESNVLFRVYENFRFHPPYLKALELVNKGVIGEVNVVSFRMWGSLNPKSDWNVPLNSWKWRITEKHNYHAPTIFDDGYHKHSIISMFFGDFKEKITRVRAWSGRQRIKGVIRWDTPAVIIYETNKDHRYGVWNVSLGSNLPIESDYYASDEFLEIQGSKGIIFVNGCTGDMFSKTSKTGPGKPGVYWLDETGQWNEDTSMPTNWKYSFINSTNNFIQALKKKEKAQLTPEIARYILQIDLAIIKSLKNNGTPVKVESIKNTP